MIGHGCSFFFFFFVSLDEVGWVILGDEVIEGADNIGEGFGEVLNFHSFRHSLPN